MRVLVLAVAPLVLLSGCFAQVTGDPPEKSCGESSDKARSTIVGVEASWAGRSFTALEDGVKLTVNGGEGDLPSDSWWGYNANAWAVAALDEKGVREALAGLVQYDSGRTTVHVGGAGQTYPERADMLASSVIIGPIDLKKDETVFVVGTADAPVSSLALLLEWVGCGETGEIEFGSHEGFVADWSDFDAPVVLANGAVGAVAYEAHFERSVDLGLVLAQPPPGGDTWGQNEASVRTSEGTKKLEALSFFMHAGGTVAYDVTHFGETGSEPLLAYMPLQTGGVFTFPFA